MKESNNKIVPKADLGAELVGTNLTLQQLHSTRSLKQSKHNRSMAAAVVSVKFRHLLLSKPAEAIAAGYQGEAFYFSPNERQLLFSIKARTLEEFALKLVSLLRFPENKT